MDAPNLNSMEGKRCTNYLKSKYATYVHLSSKCPISDPSYAAKPESNPGCIGGKPVTEPAGEPGANIFHHIIDLTSDVLATDICQFSGRGGVTDSFGKEYICITVKLLLFFFQKTVSFKL